MAFDVVPNSMVSARLERKTSCIKYNLMTKQEWARIRQKEKQKHLPPLGIGRHVAGPQQTHEYHTLLRFVCGSKSTTGNHNLLQLPDVPSSLLDRRMCKLNVSFYDLSMLILTPRVAIRQGTASSSSTQ